MAASPPIAQRRGVAVFTADRELRSRLVAKLKSLGSYDVREDDPQAFLAATRGAGQSGLVIFDVGDGTLLDDPRLFTLRERLSEHQLIVISGALSPERVRHVVRLQAADWLQSPFTDAEFEASLIQIEGSLAGLNTRVSTFIGATGGAGATTLALMATYFLARKSAAGEICLVDLDFQSASCSAYLNLGKELDLDALLASPERLDTELLDLIKFDRPPGIALYSFERPNLYFSPNANRLVLRLLDQVAVKYRDVVIDLPNLEAPWFDDVVGHSDNVFVVFETNVPSLRQARRLVTQIREKHGTRLNVVPIANKTTFKLIGNTISRGDISKMLGDAKFHAVGRDDELTTDGLNRALIPSEISQRASIVKEANKVFQTVFGK